MAVGATVLRLRRKLLVASLSLVVFFSISFALGVYSGYKQTAAFRAMVDVYLWAFPAIAPVAAVVGPPPMESPPITDAEIVDFDPLSIVDIRGPTDVDRLRSDLSAVAFGADGLPREVRQLGGEPETSGYMHDAFSDLAQVHVVRAELPLGFISHYWRLIPQEFRSCLMVYQQGHATSVLEHGGIDLMRRMLSEGCTVIALQLPHQAENQVLQYIDDPDLGPIKIIDHWYFPILQEMDSTLVGVEGTPLRFFLEPIALALNYELSIRDYDHVGMSGVSAGGWATTVYAAIDQRVTASYPIAGTLPTYLRWGTNSFGDWEQSFGPMLRAANYLEMYVMGATGPGRRQIQVLNRFDPCCFRGTAHTFYEEAIQSIAPRFRVFLDASHREHIASAEAIDVIVDDFLD